MLNQPLSIALLIALALLAANWPFATERLFGVLALKTPKTFLLRLLELTALYFVVGGVGLALEASVGQIAPQRWEFYAITATFFITLAFPGFVWRYLLKRK